MSTPPHQTCSCRWVSLVGARQGQARVTTVSSRLLSSPLLSSPLLCQSTSAIAGGGPSALRLREMRSFWFWWRTRTIESNLLSVRDPPPPVALLSRLRVMDAIQTQLLLVGERVFFFYGTVEPTIVRPITPVQHPAFMKDFSENLSELTAARKRSCCTAVRPHLCSRGFNSVTA